jgi:GT2 family glycosyltransferase
VILGPVLTSVVVVTARNPDRLAGCLTAVTQNAGDVDHEVVVVLNSAEPGLAEAAEAAAPGARCLTSEVPLGFAGGANLGVAHSSGDLVHLLHDDALPEPGWLSALVAGLAAEPRAGAAGSLLLDPDGTLQSAGGVLWQDALTSPLWIAPVETSPVDYASSASLLVRREAWEAVGGLDEELYPGQYVDVDLALSLQACGHLTVCVPGSVVRHTRGGSAGSRQKTFSAQRNRKRLLANWGEVVAAQAPRGDDAAAFGRAAECTLRRTAAVLATTPVRAEPAPPSPVDRIAALARDSAFQRDFVASLLAQLEHADRIEAEAVRMHAEIDRLHEACRVEREARVALEERLAR